MSQTSTLRGQCIAEFLGTGLLLFGAGCVAGLRVAGPVSVSGDQYYLGTWRGDGYLSDRRRFRSASESGGYHCAVAVRLFERRSCTVYYGADGWGVRAAALVYGLYQNLFLIPSWRMLYAVVWRALIWQAYFRPANPHITFAQAFAIETTIAAILMAMIMALTDDGNGIPRAPSAPLLIGLLIAVIGASMGPLTGFALNPARDFGPKIFAWLAGWGEIAFTGGRTIPYFLVPLLAPVVGAIIGLFIP